MLWELWAAGLADEALAERWRAAVGAGANCSNRSSPPHGPERLEITLPLTPRATAARARPGQQRRHGQAARQRHDEPGRHRPDTRSHRLRNPQPVMVDRPRFSSKPPRPPPVGSPQRERSQSPSNDLPVSPLRPPESPDAPHAERAGARTYSGPVSPSISGRLRRGMAPSARRLLENSSGSAAVAAAAAPAIDPFREARRRESACSTQSSGQASCREGPARVMPELVNVCTAEVRLADRWCRPQRR